MSNSNAKFLIGAPMLHVVVMSATASIGLMAMFVVDFVDMIFFDVGKCGLGRGHWVCG
jgi:hypothetical protein